MTYNDLFFRGHIAQLFQVLLIVCCISVVFALIAPAVSAGKNSSVNSMGSRNDPSVTLKPTLIIEKPYILLGDLFSNIGNKAGIKVAYSPQPGKRSRFDAKWLYRIARAYNLKWRPLTRKTHVIVERASQVIYRDEIEDVLISALKNNGYRDKFEIQIGQQANKIHIPTDQPATQHRNLLRVA